MAATGSLSAQLLNASIPKHQLWELLTPANPAVAAPYIRTDSPHFQFACYVVGGFSYADACELLDIKPETARKWRQRLQRVGAAFWGRSVSYELAARYATDMQFRTELMRICQEKATKLRETQIPVPLAGHDPRSRSCAVPSLAPKM